MPKINTLLFDVDGTLIDSIEDLVIAINRAMDEEDLRPLTQDEVRRFIGKGARNMVIRSLSALTGARPEPEVIERVYSRYVSHMAALDGQYSKLLPFVRESLQALSSTGIRMAVVTNKPTVVVAPILARFGLERFFSVALGADSVVNPKPAPDMLKAAMSALGASQATTLMVGDSMNDVLASQNAGIGCLLLRTGYNEGVSIDQWLQSNYLNRPVFDTMRELTTFVLSESGSST